MNMKVVCLISVIFISFGLNCFGQMAEVDLNVRVPSYCTCTAEDDSIYRINGISTAEDIGGVEVTKANMTRNEFYHIALENYNNFPVSVIFQSEVTTYDGRNQGRRTETGTMVLRPGEKKETQDVYWNPGNFVLIVRKLSS